MKKIILGLCFLLAYSFGFSQTKRAPYKEVNSFLKGLEKGSEYAVVKVNKEMFELLAAMDIESNGENIKDLIEGLKEITILVKEDGGKEDYEKFQRLIKSSSLKSYMSVKDEDANVNLYSAGTTDDGKLNGIVLSVSEDDETVFVHVDGQIDLAALGKLTKGLDINGLDQLKRLNDHKEKKEKE